MSRIALTSGDVRMKAVRRQYVPILSTVLATLIVLLPVVATTPLTPDIGFLVLISWRLLRPEMWTPTTALPLGLFNDLVAGHPLGQSMALWTMAFLLLDLVESKSVFRDYWMDWLIATLLILFHSFGGWLVGRMMGSEATFGIMWPHVALSILGYPVVSRFILALDRWRLTR
jgi:rod shape-determining protein MreD